MSAEGAERPKVTRGARGNIVSVADLPPPNTRWTPRRKELVIDAVRGGLITVDDLLRKYGISAEEYHTWCEACADTAPWTKLRTTDLAKNNFKHEFVSSDNRIVRSPYIIDADKLVMVHGTKLAKLTQREVTLCRALFESPDLSLSHQTVHALLGIEALPSKKVIMYGVLSKLRKKTIAIGIPPLTIVSRRGRLVLLNFGPAY